MYTCIRQGKEEEREREVTISAACTLQYVDHWSLKEVWLTVLLMFDGIGVVTETWIIPQGRRAYPLSNDVSASFATSTPSASFQEVASACGFPPMYDVYVCMDDDAWMIMMLE